MRFLLRSSFTAVAALAALGTVACSDGTGPSRPVVADVLLGALPDTIGVGDTLRITATPQDSADVALTDVRVTWRSLAPSIATVDSAGLLTARDSGDAPIVVSAHGRTLVEDTVVARVRWVPRRIVLRAAADSVVAGATLAITAELRDSRDQAVGGRVTWSSSDSLMITVDSLGVARARNEGAAWVRAEVAGRAIDSVRVRGVFTRSFVGVALRTITMGPDRMCGLDAAGKAWCQGAEPGNGSQVSAPSPVAVSGDLTYSEVRAGQVGSCALSTEGTLYCWGVNGHGSFGTGLLPSRAYTPVVAAGGLRFSDIDVGDHMATCGIAAADSVVYCWGHNDAVQVGRLPASPRDTNVAPVGGSLKAVQVDLASFHGCAVTAVQSLWCWGDPYSFEPTLTGAGWIEPREVAPAGSFVQVESGQYHTCALAPDGLASCWGSDLKAPRAVQQGSARFVRIAAGSLVDSSCGLTAGGELWCWPSGSGVEDMVARRIMPARTVRSVSMAWGVVCAVTTEGETYCWPGG